MRVRTQDIHAATRVREYIDSLRQTVKTSTNSINPLHAAIYIKYTGRDGSKQTMYSVGKLSRDKVNKNQDKCEDEQISRNYPVKMQFTFC